MEMPNSAANESGEKERKAPREYFAILERIFKESVEGMFVASYERNILLYNRVFAEILELDDEKPGYRLEYFVDFFDSLTARKLEEALRRSGTYRGEVVIYGRRGGRRSVWLSVNTVFDVGGKKPLYRIAVLTDFSELHRSREQLLYLSTHDALTGLYNRYYLRESLESLSTRAEGKERSSVAIILLQLADYERHDELLGLLYNDKLVQEAAERLKKSTESFSCEVGKLSDREFLILLPVEGRSEQQIASLSESIVKELTCHPYFFGGNDPEYLELKIHAGIALYPDDGQGSEPLIQFARAAAKEARRGGKNSVAFFSGSLDESLWTTFRLQRRIREALNNDQVLLHYQPQVSIRHGRLIGVEALLRVDDGREIPPEGGIQRMIEAAERSDVILDLGRWIVEEVCRQIGEWEQKRLHVPVVAVNVSRRELEQEGWAREVEAIVREHGVDPARIEFEITESFLGRFKGTEQKNIHRLKASGFGLAIDDFGTGYASLANLKQFDPDRIKIDRSFVIGLEENGRDFHIVKAIVAMAEALSLDLLVEGVEHRGQLEILAELGCRKIQGYYFSPPLAPRDLEKFITVEGRITQ